MNKRKIVTLALLIVVIGAIAAMLLWQPESGPSQDAVLFSEASSLFDAGRYEEVDSVCTEALQHVKDPAMEERVKRLQKSAQGHVALANLRSMIYEKGEYFQALTPLQDALRIHGNDRDLSAALAKLRITTMVAEYIQRIAKKHTPPINSVDESELHGVREELANALDRYRENKENAYLDGLTDIDEARNGIQKLHGEVSTRLSALRAAKDEWEDVLSYRSTEDWGEEVKALEGLSGYPEDIVLSFTKGSNLETLIACAKNYADGMGLYGEEKYDEALAFFQRVTVGDFHYNLAVGMIREIASNAEYYASLKLYREGKPREASLNLTRIRIDNPKFQALYELASDRKLQMDDIENFRKNSEWRLLLDKAQAFRGALENPRDSFYSQFAERMIEQAKQQIYEMERRELWDLRRETLDDLAFSFAQKDYSRTIQGCRELLSLITVERFEDLSRETEKLLSDAEDTVLSEAQSWLPKGAEQWKRYIENPITGEDRRSGITPAIRQKIALLSELYVNSRNALMGARQLPPEKVAEVEAINKQVSDEVLHQQEILYNIRDTYERLGNSESITVAETKILLLPEIEGSFWHRRIRINNPGLVAATQEDGI